MARRALVTAAAVLTAGCLAGCRASPTGAGTPAPAPAAASGPASAPASASDPAPAPPASEAPGSPPPSSAPAAGSESVDDPAPRVATSDGRPRRAALSIPALGLRGLAVVPYRGRTDDAPGSRIQDRGAAASPYGPRGGVGPGGLGNYQVTAHRTSSTQAFRMLPTLRVGQWAVVEAGGVRYVYEIRRTRETSFRSPRSLAEQRAAVPGRPGAAPARAYLTLSTCATPEDHAEGNYWSDELHNPEHRIDKIGVLVRTVVAE